MPSKNKITKRQKEVLTLLRSTNGYLYRIQSLSVTPLWAIFARNGQKTLEGHVSQRTINAMVTNGMIHQVPSGKPDKSVNYEIKPGYTG